jgi:hypothetical protein
MYLLKREELKELIQKNGKTFVTIYMPTHQSGQQTRQDPILLKNLLKKAEEQLKENKIDDTRIEKILEPGYDLLNDQNFWNKGEQGLAIFLTENYSKILKLPERFSEIVTVNSRFHLKQLLPFFTNDKRFFILTLSENQNRLIECTKYNCKQIEIEGMPNSMAKVLENFNLETTGRDIPYKGNGKNKGNTTILSGGKGGSEELDNERVLMYFREINKHLSEYMREDIAPLILATVEEHYSIFNAANTYPHLAQEFIKGNPERTSNDELHEKAQHIVEKIFNKREEDAIEKYLNLYGTKNTVHNIQDALEKAYEGRIQTLLVAKGKEKWGTFDTMSLAVEEHDLHQSEDEDLIDLAAFYTMKNEGQVIVIEDEKMPKQMEVAGILRF